MALFIPHRCPVCFESVTLIQPQYKDGAFKGPAKGRCLNCMDEQEYDLSQASNRKATPEAVKPKAETLLTCGTTIRSRSSLAFVQRVRNESHQSLGS